MLWYLFCFREELQKLKSVIGESKKSKGIKQLNPAVVGAEENFKMLTYDLKQQTAEVRLKFIMLTLPLSSFKPVQ